jgi:hypothetical protein
MTRKTLFIVLLASLFCMQIPCIALGYGGGGGDAGEGAGTTSEGDSNKPPSGFVPQDNTYVISNPSSGDSVDVTEVTMTTDKLDDVFNQLPDDVQRKLNNLYISAGGILLGFATVGLSTGGQVLVAVIYSGGTTTLVNLTEDKAHQSSTIRSMAISAVSGLVPTNPVNQDLIGRGLDAVVPSSLPGASTPPTPGIGFQPPAAR